MSVGRMETEGTRSPLEQFVRDYVEAAGGVWDEIEPQVYDVMLSAATDGGGGEPGVLRLAFDPEALPEHPQAQLASFGTPLVDRLLQAALEQGRCAELTLLGLNLQPHQLPQRIARAVKLTDPSGEPLPLEIQRLRALLFPQVVFWFEATFTSDQKEQEVLPLAVDLHHGRQVRHLEQLLDPSRLSERFSPPLPEAPGIDRGAAYLLAREQIVRTMAALANTRARELAERLDRQAARMSKYYDDLAEELEEQRRRAAARGDEDVKFAARREALARERELRITELRRKNALSVRLRLLNLLVIRQPKLLVHAVAHLATGATLPLELVFDPLVEAVEAPPCPVCQRPSFELHRQRSALVCPACVTISTPLRKHKPR
ncbi:MAG: hypothetical protein NTY19_51885 [Planctomycetota bacterium]|nr:hypothetical protein [Planctomycetota bacterium]